MTFAIECVPALRSLTGRRSFDGYSAETCHTDVDSTLDNIRIFLHLS
jgi:hypothetical protein